MRVVRQHVARLVVAWLVWQISAVTAAPLLLAGQELCTCSAAAPGAACPMHHAHQDAGECALKSAAPDSTVALASMIGGVGVIPRVQTASAAVVLLGVISALPALVISRSERPESPPPRP